LNVINNAKTEYFETVLMKIKKSLISFKKKNKIKFKRRYIERELYLLLMINYIFKIMLKIN